MFSLFLLRTASRFLEKPAYEMCFRYRLECHAIVKCFENDIVVWKAVEPY